MRHIRKLQLPVRTRLELLLLFSLGAAEIAISIVRIVTLLQISFAPPSENASKPIPAYIFPVVETFFGVISACVPLLRPAIALASQDGKRAPRPRDKGSRCQSGATRACSEKRSFAKVPSWDVSSAHVNRSVMLAFEMGIVDRIRYENDIRVRH